MLEYGFVAQKFLIIVLYWGGYFCGNSTKNGGKCNIFQRTACTIFPSLMQSVDANGNTSRDIHAIVQTCEYQVGNVRRRRRNMEETNLCSRWQLSMKSSTRLRERVNVPELYSVKAEDIHESVLVFEEHPGLCESWSGRRYVWLVKDQRKEWSNMFPLPEH